MSANPKTAGLTATIDQTFHWLTWFADGSTGRFCIQRKHQHKSFNNLECKVYYLTHEICIEI